MTVCNSLLKVEQMTTYTLNKDWVIDFDSERPEHFRIYRSDGKFFQVRFMQERWGQPILEQTPDAAGFTGHVICLVRKDQAGWQVAVSRNERPCNRFETRLVEGHRCSASNAAAISAANVCRFGGGNQADSARISDNTGFGYVDLTGQPAESLPAGLEWMSFREFYRTSGDTMTKALLGQFMVDTLGLVD